MRRSSPRSQHLHQVCVEKYKMKESGLKVFLRFISDQDKHQETRQITESFQKPYINIYKTFHLEQTSAGSVS